MRILLALDDSKSSEEALSVVARQIRSEGSEVRILHVLQPITLSAPPQMSSDYTPELQELGKRAKELLERAAKSLREAGFKAETLLKKGDIRGTILDEAAEWKADLIVLGSHGKGGAQRFLLGNVAESVARHAPCSVEIVRVRSNR